MEKSIFRFSMKNLALKRQVSHLVNFLSAQLHHDVDDAADEAHRSSGWGAYYSSPRRPPSASPRLPLAVTVASESRRGATRILEMSSSVPRVSIKVPASHGRPAGSELRRGLLRPRAGNPQYPFSLNPGHGVAGKLPVAQWEGTPDFRGL